MKITFVLPQASMAGGVRVVATYADRLRRRGHDVVVVSQPEIQSLKQRVKSVLKGGRWDTRKPASFLDQVDVPHVVLDHVGPMTDRDVPDADVVVATWWETAEWVARLSPAKGAKAHLVQHYEVWGGDPKRVDATWRLPVHRVVISEWLRDLARDKFGDHDVSHVPNSVDTDQFFAPPREKNGDPPTVGLLYCDVTFKGVDVSLRAFRKAAERVPGLKLVTFGRCGPYEHLPFPDNTEFVRGPAQDKIRDLYAKCDVWLCGSRAEGFHLPPLEAMACRCPVVSTRVGGPVDVIRDGENGYLVDVEDADALADRLVRVLRTTPQEWKRMSDAAYRTATSYTWDDATEKFEAALEHAIAVQSPAVAA